MQDFTYTSGELARRSKVTQVTVRKYADLGLLEFIIASNGTRLFKGGQEKLVRTILAERLAKRRKAPAAA
jgi:DNA-binding transcriptional MerR regulator